MFRNLDEIEKMAVMRHLREALEAGDYVVVSLPRPGLESMTAADLGRVSEECRPCEPFPQEGEEDGSV